MEAAGGSCPELPPRLLFASLLPRLQLSVIHTFLRSMLRAKTSDLDSLTAGMAGALAGAVLAAEGCHCHHFSEPRRPRCNFCINETVPPAVAHLSHQVRAARRPRAVSQAEVPPRPCAQHLHPALPGDPYPTATW